MYGVSDRFKVAVRYSHQVITKAEVLRAGQKIAEVFPESGSVEIDARRAVRRTCSLTLHASGNILTGSEVYQPYANVASAYANYTTMATESNYNAIREVIGTDYEVLDDALVPSTGADLLAPYGNEVALYRGIRYRRASDYLYASLSADHATYAALDAAVNAYGALDNLVGDIITTDEFVPLGVFLITETTVSVDEQGLTIAIDGQDRALRISRARWIDPYQIASGTNVATAIRGIIEDRWPDVVCRFSETTRTVSAVTLGLDSDNDPWQDALDIAAAAGMTLYFNPDGVCVLEPEPDYTVAATVETYAEDSEAMLLSATRGLSSEGVYNAVVATAEGSDLVTPYRAVAYDDDPASPTYVYGPFGLVPLFVSSPLINSQAAAQTFADTQLNLLRGTNEQITWTQIVDPSLDVNDIVAIYNTHAKIARAMVLDRLTIPLASTESMSAAGRTIVFAYGDVVVTSTGVVVNQPGAGNTPTTGGTVPYPGGIIRISSIT